MKKKINVVIDEKSPKQNSMKAMTEDSFANFVSRVGVTNRPNNAISYGTYLLNLVTRNRLKLESAYRGSWVVGKMIDCRADDMTREGIEITITDPDSEDKVTKIQREFQKLKVWQSLNKVKKWGDLYGGCIGLIEIEGQDRATPLRIESVSKGQFKGIVVYDRWQLNPSLGEVIKSGPDMGLPMFYDITTNNDMNDPANIGVSGGIRIHHSRVVRMIGIELPFFQAITEQMWGESKLERAWDRLIAFDTTTMSTANLVQRASVRTIKIKDLREVIGTGGPALDALLQNMEMIREFQTNDGLTLIDMEDDFISDSYAFSGLDNVLLSFGQQLAGASNTPLMRLFGEAPAGLGDTGDSVIRDYYDSIKAEQESDLRNPMEKIVDVTYRSVFGEARPDTLSFDFVPLLQMSALDKATVAKTNAETITGVFEAGLNNKGTSMKELRQTSRESGLFGNITDEQIDEADEEPPMPVDPSAEKSDTGGGGDPSGTSLPTAKNAGGVKRVGDSIRKLFKRRKK